MKHDLAKALSIASLAALPLLASAQHLQGRHCIVAGTFEEQ